MGGPAAQGPSGLGRAGLVRRGAPAAAAAATEGGAYSFFFFFVEEDAASTAAGQSADSPSASPALLEPDSLLEMAGLGLCGDLLTRGLCCFGRGLGLCRDSLGHGLCTDGPASAPAVLTGGSLSLLCLPSSAVRYSGICAEAAPAAAVLPSGSPSGFPALGCGLLLLSSAISAISAFSCSALLLLACGCSADAAFALPVSCAGAAWRPLGRGTEEGALGSVLLDALGASLGNIMGSRAASGLAAAAGCANKKRLFNMPEGCSICRKLQPNRIHCKSI